MVSLYIENKLIELDSEVQFAITKTFEDVTNPTSIINDWSKTVSIPFTDSNNEIFGHIYNPDRITLHTSNTGLTTGMYFDPLKKLNFRLEWDSMLLMQGYAKMTSITKSNGKGRYNITLNGELGKVFQEMKKITFDETAYSGTDKDKYWIDGYDYTGDLKITRSEIKRLWENEIQYDEDITSSSAKSKLINFTPNNDFVEDFDYSMIQNGTNSTIEFVELLNDVEFTQDTGISPENVIPNGFRPREYGEFRSYLQSPFIPFYKLFLIFKDKCEKILNYKFKLDTMWFNKYNPYWNKLVFMLEKFNISNKNILQNTYDVRLFENPLTAGWDSQSSIAQSRPSATHNFEIRPMQQFSPAEKIDVVNWNVTEAPFKTNSLISCNQNYVIRLRVPALYLNKREVFKLNPNNALVISVKNIYGSISNNTFQPFTSYSEDILICDNSYTGNKTGYKHIIYTGEFENESSGSYSFLTVEIPLQMNLSKITGANYYSRIELGAKWEKDIAMVYGITSKNALHSKLQIIASDQLLNIDVRENVKRSYATYTINDIWNNEYNLFEEILKYCKTYRILITVDELNKEINFVHNTTYFNNYKILDWSDKLDISREYLIQPITFENKYVVFNYEDNENSLNEGYNTKYGVNYGEYKLTTDYNFNIEEKELFNKINVGITETPYLLTYGNLLRKNISYYFPNEVYLSTSNKDKKSISSFGSLLFYNGSKYFEQTTEQGLYAPFITDDTDFQTSNSTFCYNDSSLSSVSVLKYSSLSNFYDGYFNTFAKPMENYTILEVPANTIGIYDAFWQNYLDERYNTNNKIVTCYLDIKPFDYCNFEFNNFIKIDNQLYFVNKIYDYNITSNSPTKVDLITVQDLNGYTTNNFTLNYFEVYYTPEELFDNHFHYIDLDDAKPSQTIYISSSTDVSWRISKVMEGNANNVKINGVANSGVINKGVLVPVTFSSISSNSRFEVTFTDERGNSIVITVVSDTTLMPITTANNKSVSDYQTLTIGEDGKQYITVYVTSETSVNVEIRSSEGDLTDCTINGADAVEVYNRWDDVTLSSGSKVPLTISTVFGGNDFYMELVLSNRETQRTFNVKCSW